MRIAHIADTHLGYRSATIPRRDEDFSTSWISACGAIVDSKPDIVVHAGDVFHRPNPSWRAVRDFLDGSCFLREAGVPIFAIAGNHDSSRLMAKYNVFSVLREVNPFITMAYEKAPEVHRLPEATVVLLPHQALLSPSLETDLRQSLDEIGWIQPTILVAHGDIGSLTAAKEQGSVVIPDFVVEYPWSYIALGHLHVAQPFGQTGWYSGSTERCGWSDYPAEPAWTLTSLSDQGVRHEQRSLPHLAMFQLPDLDCIAIDEVAIYDEVIGMLDRVAIPEERSVSRILLKGIHPYSRRSIQSVLQRLVHEVYPNLLFQVVTPSLLPTIWEELPEASRREAATIEEMFSDFVASRTFDNESLRKELGRVGGEALARARAAESLREETSP